MLPDVTPVRGVYGPEHPAPTERDMDGDGMCHGGPDCRCYCPGCGEHMEECECEDAPDDP